MGYLYLDDQSILTYFGFKFNKGGTHTRRTMMLDELSLLLSYISDNYATREDYIRAIYEDNCLNKRSGNNRKFTATYLTELYALDPNILLFRSLLYFWQREEKAHPLLALICAYCRDPLLRSSAPCIFNSMEGDAVNKLTLENHISKQLPDRFSNNTLSSIVRNINATWTKSGHLKGHSKKIRSRAKATPAATAYALLISYLRGARGEAIFQSEYMLLLDCSGEIAMELATEASRRGWMVFKRIGNVMEVQFPNLLTEEEMEWVYEQN